jgi:hypothetical protein
MAYEDYNSQTYNEKIQLCNVNKILILNLQKLFEINTSKANTNLNYI